MRCFAAQLSDKEVSTRNSQGREAEDAVLILMLEAETPPSVAEIATHLKFIDGKGQPQKSKAYRVLATLKKDKLITNERGDSFTLAEKGQKPARKAKYNQATAGASYG
jgi:DNA-binding PadR family transcriptional regulator